MVMQQRVTSGKAFDGWKGTASGLYVPPSYRTPKPRPKSVDLFSGCGGFSLGMMQGGWQVVAACDNDPWATITYLVNLGAYPCNLVCLSKADEQRLEKAMRQHLGVDDRGKIRSAFVSGSARNVDLPGVPNFFFGDVRKLTGEMILQATGLKVGDIDCVTGGPPCQGFSLAGKRNVMDPRNSLVFEFVRIVLELMPKTMVMENVPGIASMVTPEGLPVIDAVSLALENGGWGALDAIRKTLLANSGAGVALRTAVDAKKYHEGDEAEDEAPLQVGLFD